MGVQLPSEPITRKEQYLAKAAGQAVEIPTEPITREEAYLDAIAKSGGGGGTGDYDDLENRPKVNNITLTGNKSASDLGLASASALANKVDKVDGKDLSSNDYSDTEKQKNADNATAISAIKDGQSIDSFADVESALSNKQDTLTFDDVPTANSNNPVKSGGVKSAIDAAVSRCYHHAGTKTCAELVAGLLVAVNEGNVYNMTDSGTTTADFIEGAGQPIKAGDNVGIAKISDGVYKFDLLSGFVDTSNFVQKSETAGLLKNDGTVDITIQGDVSTLKSGLTNLDNEVNGDATTYPYADVITIPDAVPANLADCKVKIEPVQDLHGYDKPWVGGAGKNKLPMTVDSIKAANISGTWSGNNYTYNGAVFTIQTDDDGNVTGIEINETPSSDTYFYFGNKNFNGSYKVSGYQDSIYTRITVFVNNSVVTNIDNDDAPYSLTVTSSDTVNISIKLLAGRTFTNNIVRPIVCLSTETDTTFAPYTNICPITGHTEASVQRDGRNLADGIVRPIACGQNNVYVNTALPMGSIVVPIVGGRDYTVSIKNAQTIFTSTCAEFPENGDTTVDALSGTSGVSVTHKTVSTSANAKYLVVHTGSYDYEEFQVELGQTATPYVPYAGKTYTIALGDTIYGGTVNFKTGVMTVTHQYVTKNTSTMNNLEQYPGWTGSGIKQIVGGGIDDVVSTCVNVSDVIRANTLNINDILFFEKNDIGLTQTELIALAIDVAFVVELATPTTIQLTPQQIQLLKGHNTLTASTGQISVTVNGVSGSIGQMQEQVNEMAEDVAKLHYHKIAESAATGTRADKLASLYSTYNTLKNDVRKSAILLRNNADIYHAVNNSGTFSAVYVDTTTLLFMCIKLNPGSYVFNNNGTTTDGSSTENTEVYSLWIIE